MEITNTTINLSEYKPHPRNYNRHPDDQLRRIMASLQKFGQTRSVVVWNGYLIAGHGVAEAARRLGWAQLRADVLPSDYPEHLALAYIAADNELGKQSDPDEVALAAILAEVAQADKSLIEAIGYDDAGFKALLDRVTPAPAPQPVPDKPAELLNKWQVVEGQTWRIGDHYVTCGDCRQPETWRRLLEAADVQHVNGIFTSPPYAQQRKQQYGGVPAGQYVDWWQPLQEIARPSLAADGSFFVNIKPHCEEGQRVLYVADLVSVMVRSWNWLFIDEFAWLRPAPPGDWPNRFKNGFEPVFHFALQRDCKFRPRAVSEKTKGRSIDAKLNGNTRGHYNDADIIWSEARPSNVLDIKTAAGPEALGHAAAFPVALPDFFIRAFSDPGDVWLDPFLGSGTTIAAAHGATRRGLGIELLPEHVAIVLERLQGVADSAPVLVAP